MVRPKQKGKTKIVSVQNNKEMIQNKDALIKTRINTEIRASLTQSQPNLLKETSKINYINFE